MVNLATYPIHFSFGKSSYLGTFDRITEIGKGVYYHTVFHADTSPDDTYNADFYPVKIVLLNKELIKWVCKPGVICEHFKYPAAAAIQKVLQDYGIPLD